MMLRSTLLIFVLTLCGCGTTGSVQRPTCTEAQLQAWPFPAEWLQRPVSLEEAAAVVEGDLGDSPEELAEDPALQSYSEGWQALTDSAGGGGELWRYRAPPEAFGWRGVALVRECTVVADMPTLTT